VRRLSLNNGLSYVDLNSMSIDDAIFIDTHWEAIVELADLERMEIALKIVKTNSKFEFIKYYLEIADQDLIIG
jgi:hypothetical protein